MWLCQGNCFWHDFVYEYSFLHKVRSSAASCQKLKKDNQTTVKISDELTIEDGVNSKSCHRALVNNGQMYWLHRSAFVNLVGMLAFKYLIFLSYIVVIVEITMKD